MTYTWQIFYKAYEPKKLAAVRALITYELGDGQKDAESLGYIPLPDAVVKKGLAAIANLSSR